MTKLNKNQESALKIANMRSEKRTFTTIKAGETGCGFMACKQLAEMGYLEVASIRQHRGVGWDTWYRITESGKAALGMSDEPQAVVETPTAEVVAQASTPEVTLTSRRTVILRQIRDYGKWRFYNAQLRNAIWLVENGYCERDYKNNTVSLTEKGREYLAAAETRTQAWLDNMDKVLATEPQAAVAVETPAAQDSEYQPMVGDVVLMPYFDEVVTGLVISTPDENDNLYTVEYTGYSKEYRFNANEITLVSRPTIAPVAITDDSAVDNTPSEQQSEIGQPSGWVADALQSVNVTSEAAANDDYLPPTGDDNDDLPFSDLGEDDTPNWTSIDGDIIDSQRERIYELEAQNWQRNETIASLEARVRKLESIIQSANSLAYQLRSSLYPIVDSNSLAILCDIEDLTRKEAIS